MGGSTGRDASGYCIRSWKARPAVAFRDLTVCSWGRSGGAGIRW